MTTDEAIRHLRANPKYGDLVRQSFLGEDFVAMATSFEKTAEFDEVCTLLENRVKGGRILDLGAGNGISTWAFLQRGAARVFAVEPDSSEEAGLGALRRNVKDSRATVIACVGESIPLRSGTVDVVYARQVLHHTRDLRRVLSECSRVLAEDGMFIACREHVVDSEDHLRQFLDGHPVHQLTGGENAYALGEYIAAIEHAGLTLNTVLGPWDSVINAYPAVESNADLVRYPDLLLGRRFGVLGKAIAHLPGVRRVVWSRLRRPVPGRLYSFVAGK